MNCTTCREVLSAALDGEATAAERDAATAHRRSCPACEAYAVEIEALHRAVRLQPAAEVPDLSAAILSKVPRDERREDGLLVWRLGLVFVALAQLLAAAVHVEGAHVVRDQASFEAALAVGFAWTAWKPWRAAGLVPLAVVLSVLLLANGGLAPGGAGVHHLLAPVGTAFLVLIARHERPLRAVAA